MIQWLFNNRLYLIGLVAGAVAGFVYWKYVGCVTGTCAITSSPVRSTVYFAVMGTLFMGIFKKEKTSGIRSGLKIDEEADGRF